MQAKVEYLSEIHRIALGDVDTVEQLYKVIRQVFILRPHQFYLTIHTKEGEVVDENIFEKLKALSENTVKLFLHKKDHSEESDLIDICSESSYAKLDSQSLEIDAILNQA
jgi:hypothetical protein